MFRLISARLRKPGYETSRRLCQAEGSAILEFAITLPVLVVFVVGIFDFGGAFNQKQKIEQAAQEGTIVAGAQPTSDIEVDNANPDSLQPVVAAVFNSLAGSEVLPLAGQGSCRLSPLPVPVQTAGTLTWTYNISGCSGYPADTNPGCMGDASDKLWIVINRGWVAPGSTTSGAVAVGTTVTVSYNYHWRFNSAIQLLIPGATYGAKTCITESSTVHNQM